VLGFRGDDMSKGVADLGQFPFHQVGGGLLFVLRAGIGEERAVEEIPEVVRHIIDLPEGLLVVGRKTIGRQFVVFLGLGEAGTGMHAAEPVAVMDPEMPGPGTTHGETREDDAVGIYGIVGHDRRDRLEDIDLTRVFPTDALASEGVEDDRLILVLVESRRRPDSSSGID
jgi:hypothetical protein